MTELAALVFNEYNLIVQGDYNVVIVGWEGSSQQLWYPQSASDTRSVGTEIGLVAANLVARAGSHQSRLYCVGHSLGGHVCGHAGQKTKFGRITGKLLMDLSNLPSDIVYDFVNLPSNIVYVLFCYFSRVYVYLLLAKLSAKLSATVVKILRLCLVQCTKNSVHV